MLENLSDNKIDKSNVLRFIIQALKKGPSKTSKSINFKVLDYEL